MSTLSDFLNAANFKLRRFERWQCQQMMQHQTPLRQSEDDWRAAFVAWLAQGEPE